MTAKVTTYCASLTAKEKRGETKKKSNAATLSVAAKAAGPRPKRIATPTTPNRNSITMLASSSTPTSGAASSVIATLLAAAQA